MNNETTYTGRKQVESKLLGNMKSVHQLGVTLVLCAFFALGACKKTPEGEMTKWEENQARVHHLAAEYPGFASFLEDQVAIAKKSIDEAQAIDDVTASVEKMAAGNALITSGLVGTLGRVDAKKKAVERKAARAARFSVAGMDHFSTRNALVHAENVLANIEQILEAGAIDLNGARVALADVSAKLSRTERGLNAIIHSARGNQGRSARRMEATFKRSKRSKKKKHRKAKVLSAKKRQKRKKTSPATWQCHYCDSMNHNHDLKCNSCGASR